MTRKACLDRRSVVAGAALLPAMLAGGCGQSAEQLVVYSSLPRAWGDRIAEEMLNRFGVEVRFWKASRNAIVQRVMIEAARGQVGFDVIELETNFLQTIANRHPIFAGLAPSMATLDRQRHFLPARNRATALGWNTEAIDSASAPQTYRDLLDPRFRNRIVVVAHSVPWFFALHKVWGEEKAKTFFDALARQGVRASEGHSLTAELVASGEFAVCPTLYDYKLATMKRAGDPIDFALPEPVLVEQSAWAMNAKSSRRETAIAFLEFIKAREQNLLADHGIIAGSLDDFVAAYPQVRGRTVGADGLERRAVYEKWADRLQDFLDRAQRA